MKFSQHADCIIAAQYSGPVRSPVDASQNTIADKFRQKLADALGQKNMVSLRQQKSGGVL